jgi:hypothetical protein
VDHDPVGAEHGHAEPDYCAAAHSPSPGWCEPLTPSARDTLLSPLSG